MNKRARKALTISAAAAIAVAIASLAAAGAIAWLGTPSGSAWALGAIDRAALEPSGVSLKFDEARFLLFSGFRFRNLRVSWKLARAAGSLRADSAELVYSFSLARRRLAIESFLLKNPVLRGTVALAAAPRPPAPAPAGDPLQALAELVHRPPIAIDARGVAIENLDVDLVASGLPGDSAATTRVAARGASLRLALALAPDQFEARGELSTGPSLAVQHSSASTGAGLNLAAAAKWDVRLRRDGARWAYDLGSLAATARLSKLNINKKGPSGSLSASAREASFAIDATARAETSELFARERDALKAVAATATARAVDLRLEQGGPAPSSATGSATGSGPGLALGSAARGQGSRLRLSLAEQKAELKARLEGDLLVAFVESAQGLDAPAFLLRPVSLRAAATARIPRDLGSARAEGNLAVEQIEAATWSAAVEREGSAGGAFQFDVKATARADQRLAHLARAAAPLATMGSPSASLAARGRAQAGGRVEFSANGSIPRVLLPVSRQPFALELSGDGSWEGARKKLDLNAEVKTSNADFGRWQLATKSELALAGGELSAQGKSEIAQLAPGPKFPLALAKPVAISHWVSARPSATAAKLEANIPAARVERVASAADTRIRADLRVASPGPQGEPGGDREAEIEVEQGPIQLDAALAPGAPPIHGASLRLRARAGAQGAFVVDRFRGSINDGALAASGEIRGNFKTKDVLARVLFEARAARGFPRLGGVLVAGSASVPLEIAVRRGREASLGGEVILDGLSIEKGAISASGISGRVPFSERVTVDLAAKSLRFSELIEQNPFERVNFERLRPLIERAQQVTIEKISWMEKPYGPLVGFFSIRQNMVFAHQFDLNLGAGRAYGEMFLDAYPKTMRAGFLGRLTGLDLGQFLPLAFLARVPEGNRELGGRAGLVFDLNQSSIDGRVDVTSIGGPQLIAMINVLDPKFENAKLNSARTALAYGYPTGASMAFQRGYMDLDIDLTALGISQRQSVRAIPLSGLITQHTAEIVAKAKKGPIQ